jgi:hypothetical protein
VPIERRGVPTTRPDSWVGTPLRCAPIEIVRRFAWPVFWATFLFRGVTLVVDLGRTIECVAWLLCFVD